MHSRGPDHLERYKSIADPQVALRMRLKELAGVRVGYGYRRLHVHLQREGWEENHKRLYGLYRDEGLGREEALTQASRRMSKARAASKCDGEE